MEDNNDKMITEEHRISTEKTKEGIENFEKDVKEAVRSIIQEEMEPENLEILEQFTQLVQRSEYLKDQIIRRDIEIFNLRGIVADKRKHVKQSRLQLESLKSAVGKAEELARHKDLIILEHLEKVCSLTEKSSQKRIIKSPKRDQQEGNKFVTIGGTYQGVYVTRSSLKPEDKGKQELNMPFLSSSAHNWISSLRTPTKSPLRERHK